MANIFRYLKKEHAKISNEMNSLDGLVFAWLSYFNYPEQFFLESETPLKNLTKDMILKKEFYKDASNPKKSRKLMLSIYHHPRYQDLTVSDFEAETDDNSSLQFGAVTAHINENLHIVSFRGTDPGFVGWEEDFLMSLEKPVAAQVRAKNYLERQMNKYQGEFILAGHSKGGNLALFSACHLESGIERLKGIYVYENPGFKIDLPHQKELHPIVKRFIPQSSIIGMFFFQPFGSDIVKSNLPFFLQHDPFSWMIKDKDFIKLRKRTRFSYRMDKAFNSWVDGLTIQEREKFTRLLFSLLKESKAKDFFDLINQIPKYGLEIRKVYKDLDVLDRLFLKKTAKELLNEYKRHNKIQ